MDAVGYERPEGAPQARPLSRADERGRRAEQSPAGGVEADSQREPRLQELPMPALRKKAKELELAESGTKQELVARIRRHQTGD